MPAAAQQLDGWPGVVIALLGALAVVLVPLTGFMKEWWSYRKDVKAADAILKPATAREVAAAPGAAVFDSIAIADLTAAIKDLAASIRAETASDEAQHNHELTSVLKQLTDRVDSWEQENKRGHGGLFSGR